MKFVVLAPETDETALRVALCLRRRHGERNVEVRTPEELLLATWEHYVLGEHAGARVTLHDGTMLPDSREAVVLNRLRAVEPLQFAGSSSANQDYARMESFALIVSWLSSFDCRVINAPSPMALSGGFYRPLIWNGFASRAGLDTSELRGTSSTRRFPPDPGRIIRCDIDSIVDPYATMGINAFQWDSRPISNKLRSIFVIGRKVLGESAGMLADACLELATLAKVSLLRIDLSDDDSPIFVGADPCPQLAGDDAFSALVELLESRGKSR